MPTRPHPPPDETLTLPPISALTTPASSSPWLKILMLLKGPQVMPPVLLTILMLVECLPNMPPTPLTILMLAVTS
ncbi:hypothetical protein O181_132886 [Austropuccinia psidii MF-1]|uniref:Uncharacterized protein n=1 Tax=Austropuccinia psidii MF-1 TaxID=1389203 RepID=A0A9Q3L750_9BASI|nr:hypothetical protein [Austropuccinia psidii MF-1]